MKNKKIPTTILSEVEQLPIESQSLFFKLWLQADEAGVLPIVKDKALLSIERAGLIVGTKDKIILKNYLSSNYSPILKADYSPHKRPLSVINNHGFSYNVETSEIEIPIESLLRLESSLDKLEREKTLTKAPREENKVLESKIGLLEHLGSIKFALLLAMLLTLGQSFHTGYSLYLISDLPKPYNIFFAVFTALLLDALIVFFVIRGSITNSMVFLIFSTAMNLFAMHHSEAVSWFQYNSCFAILISIIIPYSIHSVASIVHRDMNPSLFAKA